MSTADTERFAVSYTLPPRDHPSYEPASCHQAESARIKLAAMLAERLANRQHWTIRFVQSMEPSREPYPWQRDTIRLEAEITPVQYRQVHMVTYEDMDWPRLARSATREVRYRIGRTFRRGWDRLAFWRR